MKIWSVLHDTYITLIEDLLSTGFPMMYVLSAVLIYQLYFSH